VTFNEYLKGEKASPPAVQPKKKAKLSQSVMQNLSRAKLLPAHVVEQIAAGECKQPIEDIASNLSHQIIDLNRLVVTDPSCAVVVKRLSEMILRLHFLVLVTNVSGDCDAAWSGNA
jgi:hypothetical protein